MAASVGPALPPHLEAKRKRQREQEEAQAATATPPRTAEEDASPKRQRVIGPAMPPQMTGVTSSNEPATQPTRQRSQSAASSTSSDDDFGPAPPSTEVNSNSISTTTSERQSALSAETLKQIKLTRDEWMTVAPSADNLGRLDPARPRPRAFNTGKGARGAKDAASAADSSLWNETPEQKRARLRNEMMGVTSTDAAPSQDMSRSSGRSKEAKTQIRQHVEQVRGPSLVEQHRERKGAAAEDDDPSGRAFDREKDMGSGMRIGSSQRERMLKKAASSVSSKFSGGGYL